ncbi:MAG: hypothetical protein CVU79_00940 [Elusimicrobia bacterium HGW-Elusimicrobia-3]|nr:MAG: hypothetical protein CVU79_00940 [Elusimicrobia bacterium HGW-Elusimicrobia-3]
MIKLFSSLRLFFALCLALGGVFVWQTVFNTGPSVYGSGWFMTLGALLAANIAACSAGRFRTASPSFLLIHAGIVLIILGSFASRFLRFEAELPLRAGTETDKVHSGNAVYRLPFAVRLESFRLDYYGEPRGVVTVMDGAGGRDFPAVAGEEIRLPERGVRIKVLRLVRDFGLDARRQVSDKSPYWHNPAAELEISGGGKKKRLWFFANFPGMHREELPYHLFYRLENAEIRNFTSAVLVRPAEGPAFAAEISVNSPLRYLGYTLYQTSYDPAEAAYTLLTVTRDRGIWVVYAGFAALLAGVLLWLKK